ncbi:hypothetical protein LS68_008520 [Helicobacter sp. MIT 05-5293]|uniref:hypothetical protein n=1 Tax=Helicobacter sp. MIT 05-5293 TaxID=1548149 RepID=UPI00051D39AC|nr:hypothetical protein [Helicobacter sp. MIT 05-5293]TLD80247.1 hypothetical protein LS68_008520 [Helicobacter sp. MIT 05-5293]
MNESTDLKPIKAFLKRHGHTDEELSRLDRDGITSLYEKDARADVMNFQRYMNQEEGLSAITSLDTADIGDLKLKIKECINDTMQLIDVIREGLNDFSYADIADILTLSIKSVSVHKLQRILRIAYREYQEILLDQIAAQLKELPIEEYKVMMSHYEEIRNDIPRLKLTLQQLSDPKKCEQILNMAHFKLHIVKDFMPSSVFNDAYREYLNNTPEKLKLVDEVLSLTGMHTKKYLKNLPMEELEEMKEKLIEDKRRDEKDHKIFVHYTQMLDEAMFGADEQEFSEVCIRAITNLNQKQILMIEDYLASKNPIFISRFNSLLHGFNKG